MFAFKFYGTAGLLLACILPCIASAAEKCAESVFTNSIGMKLVHIEPGTFTMGFDGKAPGDALKPEHIPRKYLKSGNYDESPRHKVTITNSFYISEAEVTIEQFKQSRRDFPGFKAKLDGHPYVSGISWYDAVAFCEWLSAKEGRPYRLPTEAEWEYVCRAETQTPFSSGYTPPAHETPNLWGIKNMHTGVLEWCLDWHGLYRDESQTDPVGPKHGWTKVVRGGGLLARSRNSDCGFRREGGPAILGRHAGRRIQARQPLPQVGAVSLQFVSVFR